MFKRLLHWLVARPRVYDLVQIMAGAGIVRRRLSRAMAELNGAGRASNLIVDIGGGTGAARQFAPPASRYVCVDLDPVKIYGFLRKNPEEWAVVADAAALPMADASVQTVLCILVAHHLPDDVLRRFLAEARRVLVAGGQLVFVDPLWRPRRVAGRLLWRYDRGSFPRTYDALRREVAGHFPVCEWDRFAFLHAYALGVATAPAREGAGASPAPAGLELHVAGSAV